MCISLMPGQHVPHIFNDQSFTKTMMLYVYVSERVAHVVAAAGFLSLCEWYDAI